MSLTKENPYNGTGREGEAEKKPFEILENLGGTKLETHKLMPCPTRPSCIARRGPAWLRANFGSQGGGGDLAKLAPRAAERPKQLSCMKLSLNRASSLYHSIYPAQEFVNTIERELEIS